MSLRVAFTLIGGKKWTGGYNYLLNLLKTVHLNLPGRITPILLVGKDVDPAELAPFSSAMNCEVVFSPLLDAPRQRSLQMRHLLLGGHAEIQEILRRHRIDLVFENAFFYGWRNKVPAIAWIPDLQHRFLPHLFSRSGWIQREIGFRTQIASGRTVMVSSHDSLTECERAYPSCRGRIHAVRFAIPAPPEISDADARAVANRYRLPENFLFMPNQYWAHKNHRLVIHALNKLRNTGKEVVVFASGSQLDPRQPEYAPSLIDEVQRLQLEQNFRAPGLIPYQDLAPLMQASMALLNPSLFEGWSTTVEEARSAGVPMILSDLPVHLEQADGQATFFSRNSADSLAETLAGFRPLDSAERHRLRAKARIHAGQRVHQFAAEFVELAESAAMR